MVMSSSNVLGSSVVTDVDATVMNNSNDIGSAQAKPSWATVSPSVIWSTMSSVTVPRLGVSSHSSGDDLLTEGVVDK